MAFNSSSMEGPIVYASSNGAGVVRDDNTFQEYEICVAAEMTLGETS